MERYGYASYGIFLLILRLVNAGVHLSVETLAPYLGKLIYLEYCNHLACDAGDCEFS